MQKPQVKIFLTWIGRLLVFSLVLSAPPVFCDDNISTAMESTDQPEAPATPAVNSDQAGSPATMEDNDQPAIPATVENNDQLAAPETPKAADRNPHVVRALLTTAVDNREPTDDIVSIKKDQGKIYFFTEFADLKGKAVKHRWEYQGKIMGEVNFNVGSPKWRCYSSKTILPAWTGSWKVSVVDDQDQVLAEKHFDVTD